MAKFLNTSATNYFLEELIKSAKDRLILISPFLKLNDRISLKHGIKTAEWLVETVVAQLLTQIKWTPLLDSLSPKKPLHNSLSCVVHRTFEVFFL